MSVQISVSDFDLAATLNSGQVFHWHSMGHAWHGVIGNAPITLRQAEPTLIEVLEGSAELVTHYLALDHDLAAIQKTLPKRDKHLKAALRHAPGLRIMRQPLWECLATFITSSMKQVAHIRQISLLLRQRYGEPVVSFLGPVQYAYPTPAALAAAGEAELRACGLGYRAAFLAQTAGQIARGDFNLEALAPLDDGAAILKLCELPGVGPKIAQCTLLFGCERLGMFPIDVWIERVLRALYFSEQPDSANAATLRLFAHDHFGKYRGYAQQWLFHHARTGGMFPKRVKE